MGNLNFNSVQVLLAAGGTALVLFLFNNCSQKFESRLLSSAKETVIITDGSVGPAIEACKTLGVSTILAGAPKPQMTMSPIAEGATLDTIDSILSPIPDGKPLYIPQAEFPSQPYLACGLLDVTSPPFNADRTGVSDSTLAIQSALDAASFYNLVVYFPLGQYTVTDSISCVQPLYKRTNGKIVGGMQGACYLLGQQSASKGRPVIYLPPYSDGFLASNATKTLIEIWAREAPNRGGPLPPTSNRSQPNINMNNYIVGLDFKVGAGNESVVVIAMPAAQGSVIEDVTIDLGDGFIGIDGIPGSGGSITNVEVRGGEIGVRSIRDHDGVISTSRGPSVVGLRLTDQRQNAIVFGQFDAFTVTGSYIRLAAGSKGPAIYIPRESAAANANLSLIDSVIEFSARATGNLAIKSRAGVYINNSYFKYTDDIHVVDVADPEIDYSVVSGLNTENWFVVEEYARADSLTGVGPDSVTYTQTQSIFINGVKTAEYLPIRGPVDRLPTDLLSKHVWAQSLERLDNPNTVNVRTAPYLAVGDGQADDTAALQAAVDAAEVVFIPKGYYRVRKPIQLRPNTKIIGLGTISSILGDPFSPVFQNGEVIQPLIRTAEIAEAETEISFIELFVSVRAAGMSALEWVSGGDSLIRNMQLVRRSDSGFITVAPLARYELNGPLVTMRGSAGGRIYNFNSGFSSNLAPKYRHLLIDGTWKPLKFYQFNVEGGKGEAMAEIRGSKNIVIDHIKIEGEYLPLWIKNSDNIKVFGNAGNGYSIGFDFNYPTGYTQETPSLYRIENSTNITMANLASTLRKACDDSLPMLEGCGVAPDKWYMLIDINPINGRFTSEPLERPILYKTH